MSDIAKCTHCSGYFDNSIAVSKCPKCGESIDGVNLSNETFGSSTVKGSAQEIAQIESYTALNIFSIFFCLPLGAVGMIFSILTLNDKRKSDYAAAISHSALAKKFMIASFALGGFIFAMNIIGRLSR